MPLKKEQAEPMDCHRPAVNRKNHKEVTVMSQEHSITGNRKRSAKFYALRIEDCKDCPGWPSGPTAICPAPTPGPGAAPLATTRTPPPSALLPPPRRTAPAPRARQPCGPGSTVSARSKLIFSHFRKYLAKLYDYIRLGNNPQKSISLEVGHYWIIRVAAGNYCFDMGINIK